MNNEELSKQGIFLRMVFFFFLVKEDMYICYRFARERKKKMSLQWMKQVNCHCYTKIK